MAEVDAAAAYEAARARAHRMLDALIGAEAQLIEVQQRHARVVQQLVDADKDQGVKEDAPEEPLSYYAAAVGPAD